MMRPTFLGSLVNIRFEGYHEPSDRARSPLAIVVSFQWGSDGANDRSPGRSGCGDEVIRRRHNRPLPATVHETKRASQSVIIAQAVDAVRPCCMDQMFYQLRLPGRRGF